MVNVAVVIPAVFLVLVILAAVFGMLLRQFCCEKDKKSKDNLEPTISKGHKSVGPREVRSDGSFKYTPIGPTDTKPKEPRKIHDIEPDDSDEKKKANEITDKNNPDQTVLINKNGNVMKKVSTNETMKINKNGKKSRSEDSIKGQKVMIIHRPKGTTSPPLNPSTSSGQSLLTSPTSPKTSPSSSSKRESPGKASNMTSDSAPEPTPILTKFENDAKLVDDKTLNPR